MIVLHVLQKLLQLNFHYQPTTGALGLGEKIIKAGLFKSANNELVTRNFMLPCFKR